MEDHGTNRATTPSVRDSFKTDADAIAGPPHHHAPTWLVVQSDRQALRDAIRMPHKNAGPAAGQIPNDAGDRWFAIPTVDLRGDVADFLARFAAAIERLLAKAIKPVLETLIERLLVNEKVMHGGRGLPKRITIVVIEAVGACWPWLN